MDEQRAARVAVVSTQPVYLRGLASLVMGLPGISLVGEGQTPTEAFQLSQMAQPDLFLLDLPGDLGVETSRQILGTWPGMKIILMTASSAGEAASGDGLHCFSRDIPEDELKSELLGLLQPAAESTLLSRISSGAGADPEGEGAEEPMSLAQVLARYRQQDTMARELVMAGRIQADILPEVAPTIPGWDIAAVLEPARETSGDFYDFIPLSNNKWGMVVADVTDKGMGAALLMALSSTLFRTFAIQFPTLPAVTLGSVSRRILSDTRGSMFVTAFYAVLEPHTGRLVYANAGHPPGFLVSSQHGKETIETLRTTGMSMGVEEGAEWKQKMTRLAPGDLLVMYTDGITEAENSAGEAYAEERLIDVIFDHLGCPAAEIQAALLEEVHGFVGSAPRQDDIALIVVKREK